MDMEFTDIPIPTSLYKKIEEKTEGKGLTAVVSYVTKVLEDSLTKELGSKEAFTKEEEEKVKDRLKALGYID